MLRDGHSPASAIYTYEDGLHIIAESDQELLAETLVDRAIDPDYGYVVRLFYKYHNNVLGSRNGKKMFERLTEVIDNYNSSGNGRAIMQVTSVRCASQKSIHPLHCDQFSVPHSRKNFESWRPLLSCRLLCFIRPFKHLNYAFVHAVQQVLEY